MFGGLDQTAQETTNPAYLENQLGQSISLFYDEPAPLEIVLLKHCLLPQGNKCGDVVVQKCSFCFLAAADFCLEADAMKLMRCFTA